MNLFLDHIVVIFFHLAFYAFVCFVCNVKYLWVAMINLTFVSPSIELYFCLVFLNIFCLVAMWEFILCGVRVARFAACLICILAHKGPISLNCLRIKINSQAQTLSCAKQAEKS